MLKYSKNDIVLVRYPFSDLSNSKVRPAIVVSAPHPSQDIFIVPLTSKTTSLLPGEFVISDWSTVGLNVPTAVKRGVYTAHQSLVVAAICQLAEPNIERLVHLLENWLGLQRQSTTKLNDS